MIKGIAKLKDFGVYQHYEKPHEINDFGVKNLIYGWNYTGKTTLSRLFAQLESKTKNPDFSGSTFTIETDSESITESNFTQTNLTIRVFNSDFVRDNLNFTGQSFKPILLLGKESESAQIKLNQCERRRNHTHEKIADTERDQRNLKANVADAKTTSAAKIKKTLGLVQAYTATHLNQDLKKISRNEGLYRLTDDQLRNDLKLSLTPDNERPIIIDRLVTTVSIDSLYSESVELLAAIPNLTSTIKHLEENPQIENWVDTGITLHSENDKCEFCGGELTTHRLRELQAHFSKDLVEFKSKVKQLHFRIQKARISIDLPKKVEFNPQFRESFHTVSIPLKTALDEFNHSIDTLANEVQNKINNSFKAIKPSTIPNNLALVITEIVEAINSVIDDNNEIVINFNQAKKHAIERVKYHFVQEFIVNQSKLASGIKLSQLSDRLIRWNKLDTNTENRINKLKAIISQAQIGREDINKRLTSMLGAEAVQIQVVSDNDQERFQLLRKNGSPAKNLSDGEKTAIAFSYFLTKLKELKPEQFRETIVYIDDPISSLDANHIFQVTAAIREFFFCQDDESGAWGTSCKQVFISTHNSEFFHLLRELKPNKPTPAPLYIIKRVGSQTSTLCNMPISLSRYSSEYHFLFEIIQRFDNAPDKTDYEILMLLPNAVRRFVELYTYSRLPGVSGETVDKRAETLFGSEKSKRILKVFHYFSHANSIDRLVGNNELIFDVEHAVRDLLSAIKELDPLHWNALEQATIDQ